MMKKIGYVIFTVLPAIFIFSCSGREKTDLNRAFDTFAITDSTITMAVEDEIGYHPEVSSQYIDVNTKEGIVTLSGTTDNLLSKERALEIASQVKGVSGVINQIDVRNENVPDQELKNRIRGGLNADPVTNVWEIDVTVDSGKVTLRGDVDSWQQVKFAGDVAKAINGVKEVNNELVFHVEERRPDDEIKVEIERIFLTNALLDHALIDVGVSDGRVVLTGTVGSFREKSLAVANAYVAGVDTVDASNLKVEYWARDPKLKTDKYVKRTDSEIENAVRTAFLYDERVNDFSFNVKVNDGKVTLTGITTNLRAKNSAGEDARNIVGVWSVDNRIKVRPVEKAADSLLLPQVVSALKNNSYLNDYTFNIQIINGRLIIGGTVNTPYEKVLAQNIVEKIPGIAMVVNQINVTDFFRKNRAKVDNTATEYYTEADVPPDRVIKSNIEREFWRSPFINENEIKVNVSNGLVTLTGTVETGIEKNLATKNAYEGGALTVQNDIAVRFRGE